MPAELAERYGGPLAFPATRPRVVANFVSTVDGVVSYALPGRAAASFVSGGNEADRFVLALLRACADAIVVGAGTLRQERDHIWTPDFVFPELAGQFAALRHAMGKPLRAPIIFVSASGAIDREAPVFSAGLPIRVLTGKRSSAEIVVESGAGLILCEGGPTLLGVFLREQALDELFLTIAPRFAGRANAARRPALVEGWAFSPESSPRGTLLSLKRSGDFAFLRYSLETKAFRSSTA